MLNGEPSGPSAYETLKPNQPDEANIIDDLFDRLFPICRSLTGDGVRKSLGILREQIPLNVHEIPSGTRCYDWKVPKEWNIEDAYVADLRGNRVIDFRENNLHLMSYSAPVNQLIDREELLKHIHSDPDLPDAIPYRTSYYKENWGFCIEHSKIGKLKDAKYKVVIQSRLEDGHLTLADCVLPGRSDQEILFSTYICHPSMANNELSGPLVATLLYNRIKALPHRKYTYRFLFVPETIGSIAYLAQHGDHLMKKMQAGFVITCVGDEGKFHYKKSRRGNSLPDRAAHNVLKFCGEAYSEIDFYPSGSDERQFCSPGFNLPVGSLMRTMYGTYPEYHTSLDNRELVTNRGLLGSLDRYFELVQTLELNSHYINTLPFGEPQLGKRGLYPSVGGNVKQNTLDFKIMQYLLNFSDGEYDLIDISEKCDVPVPRMKGMLEKLIQAGLLKESRSS